MGLVPKPDQVVAAAGNVARRVLYGGLADLRPMPRTLIDEGDLRQVYQYRPSETTGEPDEARDPVLLVSPLAAPPLCYDLRRDCSLVEHLVDEGRPTYLVEYGEVPFRDRDLGIDPASQPDPLRATVQLGADLVLRNLEHRRQERGRTLAISDLGRRRKDRLELDRGREQRPVPIADLTALGGDLLDLRQLMQRHGGKAPLLDDVPPHEPKSAASAPASLTLTAMWRLATPDARRTTISLSISRR